MNKQQILDFNAKNIAEFRSNGGTLSSFGDAPVLLLTTIGAKSGLERINPMMYLADDHEADRVYVFASAAGADNHPAWYWNLVTHPDQVTVEIGSARLGAKIEVLTDPERARIYDVQAKRFSGFASYQARTARPIPVVALGLDRTSASVAATRRIIDQSEGDPS